MDLKDCGTPLGVRHIHHDLAVEAARAQERRVEHVGTVGRRDEDHAAVGVESVHLDQQLVQSLLALVVPATEAGAALPSHRVDLVDEDQAGAMRLGGVKQISHSGRTHADEHLDEIGARDVEERHARLAGDGARKVGLAHSGRAREEDALGDLRTQRRILLGVLEEIDDLKQF